MVMSDFIDTYANAWITQMVPKTVFEVTLSENLSIKFNFKISNQQVMSKNKFLTRKKFCFFKRSDSRISQ